MKSNQLKTLILNFSLLSGGEIVCKIATFAAFVFLARMLGPSLFGMVEFVIAVTLVLSLIVDFGTGPFGAREIAKDPTISGALLSNVVVIRMMLAAGCYLIVTVTALTLLEQSTVKPLILVYGMTLFAIPLFLQWLFQGLELMRWIALGSVTRQLVFAVGVFFLVRNPTDVQRVAYIECLAVVSMLAIHWLVFKTCLRVKPGRTDASVMRRTLLEAFPIGLSELTWALTWYFATILLGLIAESELVGWFASAHRPVLALHTFVWLYFFNLLPTLSRKAHRSITEFRTTLATSIKLTAWPAVFIGLAGVLMAEPVIILVFGPNYAASVEVFRILIVLIPVALISGHYRYALIAFNLQRYEFLSSLYSAISCIGLVYYLTQHYGATGAAWGLLGAQFINLILAWIYVRRKITRLPLLQNLVKPGVAGLLLVLVYNGSMLTELTNPWLIFGLSSIFFFLLIPITEPEIRTLVKKRIF